MIALKRELTCTDLLDARIIRDELRAGRLRFVRSNGVTNTYDVDPDLSRRALDLVDNVLVPVLQEWTR